jgi:hypothetical protein
MKLPLGANIAIGFAPYLAFFVGMRFLSVIAGLWGALIIAAFIVFRGRASGGSMKILEIGAVLLFAALAIFTTVTRFDWSVMSVRLVVDAGLLVVILASLATGQPFTLQYARERVAREVWGHPLFKSINRDITLCWAAAFALLVAAHAAVVFGWGVPFAVDIALTVIVLAAAVRFSTWYPAYARKKAGVAAGS